MDVRIFLRQGCLIGIFLILFSLAIVPAAADESGTTYLVIYVIGSDHESDSNRATINLAELAENWDPAVGDVLIIYGVAKRPAGITGSR